MTLSALRPSQRAPVAVVSQKIFPGYAGGPRDPRLEILDGRTGRVTAQVSLGSAPLSGPLLAGMDVPGAPTDVNVAVQGRFVRVSFQPGDDATSFSIDVGSAPGLTNLLSLPVGFATDLIFHNVPPGTYYLRVHGRNDVGVSAPSDEIRVEIQ